MKLEFIDADEALKALNVGDIFDDDDFKLAIDYDKPLAYDVSELDCRFDGVYLELTRKLTGYKVIEWSVVCQDVILVVDTDTKRVLYTSKEYSKYDRLDPNCPFYEEFKQTFESGFKYNNKLFLAPDTDEFEDI